MKCTVCNSEINETEKFCGECGNEIKIKKTGISRRNILIIFAVIVGISVIIFFLPNQIEPTEPVLKVSPDPFSFNLGNLNAGETESQTFSISNAGKGALNWNVSCDVPWMTENPKSGTNSDTVQFNIDTTGLDTGDYRGNITVTSNGGMRAGVISFSIPGPTPPTPTPPTPTTPTPIAPIAPTITPPPPVLEVFPNTFPIDLGSLNTGDIRSRTFTISNTGGGILTWKVSADKKWITLSPTSGTNSGTISLDINTAGLSQGDYKGTITVTSNDGTMTGFVLLNIEPILTVTTPLLPDLYVNQFLLDPSTPVQESPLSVRVGVYNKGTGGSEAFNLQWWAGENFTNPGCTWAVDSLPASGGRILTCTYSGYSSWYGRLTTKVVVDSGGVVEESNEDNNIYKKIISVTRSGIVFDAFPDGTPIRSERILKGDEFLAKGIRLAGAPESTYCDDASPAIRLPATNIPFNFLTTARPPDLSVCNFIPIRITFTIPVRLVTLTFCRCECHLYYESLR